MPHSNVTSAPQAHALDDPTRASALRSLHSQSPARQRRALRKVPSDLPSGYRWEYWESRQDLRGQNCLMHSGFEPSVVRSLGQHPRDVRTMGQVEHAVAAGRVTPVTASDSDPGRQIARVFRERARCDRQERRRPRSPHSERKFETVGTDYAVLAVEGLNDVDVDFVRARARRRRQPQRHLRPLSRRDVRREPHHVADSR